MGNNLANDTGYKGIRHTKEDRANAEKLEVLDVSVSTLYSQALKQWVEYDDHRARANALLDQWDDGAVTVAELHRFVRNVAGRSR